MSVEKFIGRENLQDLDATRGHEPAWGRSAFWTAPANTTCDGALAWAAEVGTVGQSGVARPCMPPQSKKLLGQRSFMGRRTEMATTLDHSCHFAVIPAFGGLA